MKTLKNKIASPIFVLSLAPAITACWNLGTPPELVYDSETVIDTIGDTNKDTDEDVDNDIDINTDIEKDTDTNTDMTMDTETGGGTVDGKAATTQLVQSTGAGPVRTSSVKGWIVVGGTPGGGAVQATSHLVRVGAATPMTQTFRITSDEQ